MKTVIFVSQNRTLKNYGFFGAVRDAASRSQN